MAKKMKGSGDDIYDPLCGGIFKEEYGYIFPWPITYTGEKVNCFTWFNKGNVLVLPRDV